jgi:hypothetical protein
MANKLQLQRVLEIFLSVFMEGIAEPPLTAFQALFAKAINITPNATLTTQFQQLLAC